MTNQFKDVGIVFVVKFKLIHVLDQLIFSVICKREIVSKNDRIDVNNKYLYIITAFALISLSTKLIQ